MKVILVILALVLSVFATVDINLASAKELSSLSGIGSKKAEAIVSYRNDIKCFKNVNELSNVKGIGKATISKNIDNLSAGSCK